MFKRLLLANHGEIACRLLRTAQKAGVDALHPGYGFLSENTEFATACFEAGITFVGPAPKRLADMDLLEFEGGGDGTPLAQAS